MESHHAIVQTPTHIALADTPCEPMNRHDESPNGPGDNGPPALWPDPTQPIPIPYHHPIPTLVRQHAHTGNDRCAIHQGEKAWTYRQLDEAVSTLADALIRAGISSGSVVTVTGERSFGLIASLLAVLCSGGVILPLDPDLPLSRRRMMVAATRAAGSIAVGHATAFLSLAGQPSVQLQVEADTGRLLAANGPGAALSERALSPLSPDDAAYVFFTSGSTGIPKGVLGTHAGLSHFLHWQRKTFAVSPADRVAQLTNLSFDVMLRDIFLPLTAGAALVLPSRDTLNSASDVLAWLAFQEISILHAVPTLAAHWMQACSSSVRMPCLRVIFFAGEPLTGRLVTQCRESFGANATIVNLYGPTETTLAKLYSIVGQVPDNGVLPIGCPLPDTQALVLSDRQEICGVCEEGEIVLRTPFRTRGYVNAPEEQTRRFVSNPFVASPEDLVYRTGDMGFYRADGAIEIRGRCDQQIKLRGIRIEPGDIEAALSRHPAVRQAVVVLREFAPGDQRLVAYLICAGQAAPSATELRALLGDSLPVAMVPSTFVFLKELPRTPSGKIDRRSLPDPDSVSPEQQGASVAPQDQLDNRLLNLWEKIFGHGPLDMRADFFELGGSSLLAVRMYAEIEAMFGKNLPVSTLLSHSRLADLADLIRSRRWLDPWSSLVPLQPKGSRTPLFYIHAGGGNLLIYRNLSLSLGSDQPVYGLQPKGLDGILDPLRTVEDMADHYVALIFSIQPQGPYYLAGLSGGGTIALEMAQRLRARGQEIAFLGMFDTTGPQGYLPLPLPDRIRSVLGWYMADRFDVFRLFLRKSTAALQKRDVRTIWRLVLAACGLFREALTPDQRRQQSKAADVLHRRLTAYRHGRTAGLSRFVDSLLIFLLQNSSRPFFAGILAEGVAYPADDGETEQLRWIQELSDRATRTYVPAPYGGMITYFQAIDSPPGVRPCPEGGWATIARGGIELFLVPGNHTTIMTSPVLAAQLKECLQKAARRAGPVGDTRPAPPSGKR